MIPRDKCAIAVAAVAATVDFACESLNLSLLLWGALATTYAFNTNSLSLVIKSQQL